MRCEFPLPVGNAGFAPEYTLGEYAGAAVAYPTGNPATRHNKRESGNTY